MTQSFLGNDIVVEQLSIQKPTELFVCLLRRRLKSQVFRNYEASDLTAAPSLTCRQQGSSLKHARVGEEQESQLQAANATPMLK